MKQLIMIVLLIMLTTLFGVLISPPVATIGGWPALAVVFLAIYAVQAIGFVHAVRYNTEHYYDLTGSLSFIGAIVTAGFVAQPLSIQGGLLLFMVIVWALRLGSFLFSRVREVGEDQRFRKIKTSKPRFALVWTLQGLWVALTSCAALTAVLAGKSLSEMSIMECVVLGLGGSFWVFGLLTEVIADRQKTAFRRDPANAGRFIQTGLWSRSRHPNYWGEMVLWLGVAITASPALEGLQWLVWISPVFVYLLLTRVSGIPTLVQRAERTWGNDAGYQHYVATTPRLLPKILG